MLLYLVLVRLPCIDAHGIVYGFFTVAFEGFPGSSDDKVSACNVGDLGSISGSEDPLEKEMTTHSGILAWKIPWTEEQESDVT